MSLRKNIHNFNRSVHRSNTRGVTPIDAVSRAATVVKMQSKGQGTFWGLVKWSSVVLGPMSSTAGNQEAWPSLCACAVNRWSTGQGQKLAVVKRSRPFLDGQKSWPWSQLWTRHLWEWPPLATVYRQQASPQPWKFGLRSHQKQSQRLKFFWGSMPLDPKKVNELYNIPANEKAFEVLL